MSIYLILYFSPKIYSHMAEPNRFREAIILAGLMILGMYLTFLTVGYTIYGSSSKVMSKFNLYSINKVKYACI